MKKILSIIAIVFLCTTFVFASPLRFVFGDLGQHPEILAGFIPSYFMGGIGYELPQIIDGNKTELQFLAGVGYNQRKLWQNQETGKPIEDNPLIYDVIQTDWSIRFAQGFLKSPVKDKDLITLTVSYDGKFESAIDSMAVGKERKNNTKAPVKPLESWLVGNSPIYPELSGNHQHLGTAFSFQAKVDLMDDRKTTTDGFVAKFDAKYAPRPLNNALSGYVDYYQFSLNTVGAKTLFVLNDEAGSDLFSIVLIDRFNIGYQNGIAVPAYASGPFSLGRKVRGYRTWTYNTDFALVNNLDIRFAGANLGVNGIFPRINLFLDLGYGCGEYTNSNISSGDGNFLASMGVQATVSFFDFIDLGYQIAYLFTGKNFVSPASNIVGSFTFFLDF